MKGEGSRPVSLQQEVDCVCPADSCVSTVHGFITVTVSDHKCLNLPYTRTQFQASSWLATEPGSEIVTG